MKFSGGFFSAVRRGDCGRPAYFKPLRGLRAEGLSILSTNRWSCAWCMPVDCTFRLLCKRRRQQSNSERTLEREGGGLQQETDLLLPQPSNYISWRFANSKYVISLHLHIFQRVGSRSVRLLRRKKIWDAYFTLSSPHFRESESHPLERRPWCHVALNKCTNT